MLGDVGDAVSGIFLNLVFCINFRDDLEMIFENFRELRTILRCDQVKRIIVQHSHVVLARFLPVVGGLFELHCFNRSRQISAMKLRRLVGLEELLPNSDMGDAHWGRHHQEKTGDGNFLVHLDDSRFDRLTLQKMSAM